MDVGYIVLIVFGSIIGAYLLLVFIDVMFVISFHSLLKKHIIALNIFLQTKYDCLASLVHLLAKYQKNLDVKYFQVIEDIDIKHISKPHTKEGESVRRRLAQLQSDLLYLVNSDPRLDKHEEFIRAKEHIQELDQIYYVQITTYNADVIGYNYWIRFVPTRFIYTLLKIKKKDIIV